jgi:predicted membrane-bound spermidine synthase
MSKTAPNNASSSPHQGQLVLYITVTITGAAVMILELLGTRIIGQLYGVSLYVWSSLIAVTLIALALVTSLYSPRSTRAEQFQPDASARCTAPANCSGISLPS